MREGDALGAGMPHCARCVAVAALAVLWAAAAPAEPEGPGPYEQMTALSRELFAALDRDRAGARGSTERAEALIDGVVTAHFDPEYMAHRVLGTHWRDASPALQQRFARALYRTLLRTYAESVIEWTADDLRILPFDGDAAALSATVRTEVRRPGRPLVRVNYKLRSSAGGWKIFDVSVDGVSYERSYHDDIEAEVGRKGLEGAVASLEQRIAQRRALRLPAAH